MALTDSPRRRRSPESEKGGGMGGACFPFSAGTLWKTRDHGLRRSPTHERREGASRGVGLLMFSSPSRRSTN